MTEQDKGNLLIQVTAWAGLTVCVWERTKQIVCCVKLLASLSTNQI